MALLFDADAENIDVGSAASLDNLAVCTVMIIFRQTEGTDLHHMWHKGNFFLREQNAMNITFYRDYATTDLSLITSDTPITQNVWTIAFAVDGGAGVAPVIYHAQIGSELAEATSYSTQDTPAGALVSDAGNDAFIGHNNDTPARSFVGDIARVIIFNQALLLGQCKTVYNRPAIALNYGAVLWTECGYNGTGAQPDWSGNGNSGTVTGATVADHAPLSLPFGFDVGASYIVTPAVGAAGIMTTNPGIWGPTF